MAGTPDKGKSKSTSPRATTARKPARKPKAKAVSEAMIAERAYFIFESGTGGNDVDHWLQAERELTAA